MFALPALTAARVSGRNAASSTAPVAKHPCLPALRASLGSPALEHCPSPGNTTAPTARSHWPWERWGEGGPGPVSCTWDPWGHTGPDHSLLWARQGSSRRRRPTAASLRRPCTDLHLAVLYSGSPREDELLSMQLHPMNRSQTALWYLLCTL